MRQLYDAIAFLLPYSAQTSKEVTASDQELLDKYLATLSDGTSQLVSHGQNKSENFSLISRSINEIAHDIETAFRGEWPRYAYFSVMELTEHCVACHARLPADSQNMFGQRLLARMKFDELTITDQVSIMIATREFNAALNMIERQLMDPTISATDADFSGLFISYLRIALAIQDDLARPREFFKQYLVRPDIPHYLHYRIRFWQDALTSLAPKLKEQPTFENAMQTVTSSSGLFKVPGTRMRAVHDLVSANLLHRYLQFGQEKNSENRAEAFFQLGMIALRTLEQNFIVPEMEFLFVAAIEANPGGPRAATAYRLLEEYGYVGSEHLAEQEALVQRVVDMPRLRELAKIPAR